MIFDLMGYIGYALVVAFYPAQLFETMKRQSLNLGLWPLVSLTLGLAILEPAFIATGTLPYIIGNGLGMIFSAVILFLKLTEKTTLR